MLSSSSVCIAVTMACSSAHAGLDGQTATIDYLLLSPVPEPATTALYAIGPVELGTAARSLRP